MSFLSRQVEFFNVVLNDCSIFNLAIEMLLLFNQACWRAEIQYKGSHEIYLQIMFL